MYIRTQRALAVGVSVGCFIYVVDVVLAIFLLIYIEKRDRVNK